MIRITQFRLQLWLSSPVDRGPSDLRGKFLGYGQYISNLVTVENVLSTVPPLNVFFHRFLNQNNQRLWNELVGRIIHVIFNDQTVVFRWNLHQND
jgi:hypothetical protein